MPVYRYQQSSFDASVLARYVPGAIAVGGTGPAIFVDISAPSGSKTDLDEVMFENGWIFDSTDPIPPPATQSAQEISLSWKDACRVATTANITLSGTQTIDGVAVVANDRVVVKNQTLPAENGPYAVAAGAWIRTHDANSTPTLISGTSAVVTEGTQTGIWQVTTTGTIVVGTTPITWAKLTDANGPHEDLDTLVHDLAETSFTEVTRTGQVTDVITWTSAAKITKVREVNLTRSSGQISVVVVKQYNAAGSLIQTLTHTIARSGGQVASITTVET